MTLQTTISTKYRQTPSAGIANGYNGDLPLIRLIEAFPTDKGLGVGLHQSQDDIASEGTVLIS